MGSKISIPICRKSNHAQEGIRVFLKVGGIALCLVWFSLLFASKSESLEISQMTKYIQ